MDQRISQNR